MSADDDGFEGGIEEQLRRVLEPLEALLVEERAREREIRDELEQVTSKFRDRIRESRARQLKLERTLRSADALPESDPPPPKRNLGPPTDESIRAWRPSQTEAALEFIERRGEATVSELVKEFGYSRGTGDQIVKVLRVEEKIRLAGKRPRPDASRIYKPMNSREEVRG